MKVIDKSFSSNNINDIIIKDLSNKELSQHEKTILSNLYVSFPKKDIEKNNPDILCENFDDNSLVRILSDVLQDPLAWHKLELRYNKMESIRPSININDIIIKDVSNKELSQHEKAILSNVYVSFPKKDIEKNIQI